ncbi:non-ribosomal peptide synthetase, partial [Paenibacillus polymyxa]|uniref:non-ribosomal peptide synthetase n=1 Tax=Paenibacillus polymyxa TaxID=1406 RepID=UPI0012BC17AF
EAQQDWMKRQEAYWLNTFRGNLPVLNLPTDFARPAVRSTAGDTVVFRLEREVSERLKELAAQTGSTLYMVLLAAYTALLYQYTGQEDIIVGTPIAGRPHADLEPIIGMFVGTLALRNYPTAEQTFRSFLEDVKIRALQAYEHQDYPFENLVDKLNVKRDMSRNPIFDTMFVLQNTEQSELKLKELSFRLYDIEQTPVKFDLTLEAREEESGIQFGLQYATTLYQRETIEQITRHFVRLAEVIAASPDTTLSELEWITVEETVDVLKVHQERQKASRYWTAYLDGYEEQARLPQAKIQSKTGYQAERLDFDLGAGLTAGIQQIAKRYQVTMNTLMQTVWGMLLQKYNGTDDVVFGSVVSGRPAEIPNVEHIIGLFINTIPVRIHSHKDSLFSDVMKQNQEQSIASQAYDTYPLYEIQGLSELKQDLINHILIFENYPMEEQIEQLGEGEASSFRITGVESVEQTNYDFNLVVLPGNTIHMSFVYNALAFERESVEQIQGHLMELLKQVVANPDISVRELDVLSEPEREQILRVWGDTAADYPSEQTIHGLFEAQAAQTPEQAALFCEGEQLSYRELNERANRLARTLRSHGVTSDRLVGLITDRSVDMIVGIFGILKAGGAYVPIDPTYPEERIRYMLDDSGAELLLTQNHLVGNVAFDGKVLVLDGEQAVYHEDGSNLEPVSGPNDLAYVIYTSGTTGQPKGVMLEHHGLCNLKVYFDQTLHIGISDHILLFASYSFDAACWEIFQALFCGATLYVPTSETILNYERFKQYMADHHITVATLPPTYAVYLEPERMSSLRILFTAGSASSIELVYKWKDQVAYYNGYGPTENSVATSIWPVSEDARAGQLISIGRPVPNHRVYMVDAHGHLAPVGVAGELCVSGPGLARGYLDRPELTEEKFVPNPFGNGEAGYERMYRTGDLARWMPDGNIEFLGRIDHQVKIRGYRIELGEVEAQILKVEDVQEVIVLARADEQGQNQLVAYYVAEREVNAGELRSLLGEKLPNYMVPAYFVQLENMPLTPNGKIDRKVLPALETNFQGRSEYVAPQTDAEQVLASIWQTVLGKKPIGLLENFFDLGGDSIKAIQVSSRLLQAGYKLDMKTLFKHPSVSELAPYLSVAGVRTAEQGEIKGNVLLTPIQHWFADLDETAAHHFNQAVMLHQDQRFNESALRLTLTKLVEHHDILRTVFRKTEHSYEAWNRGTQEGELYHLDMLDFDDIPIGSELNQAIEAKANEIQSSISLNEGPLMKVGLFRCADGDHLLIVIHHLVVDGVSWRILFEDFATAYAQAVNGEAIHLPDKTDSFRAWSEKLAVYAISPAMESERAYWEQLDKVISSDQAILPEDYKHDGRFMIRDMDTVTMQLTEEETVQLLKQAHHAYSTEVNDLLLTALGMTLYAWTGHESIFINLEGHGRESIIPDIDISRTVGWFTSQYPVLLNIGEKSDVSRRIKQVKEGLRQIPHKGIGYSIWRYLSKTGQKGGHPEPQVNFNYLGEFDQDLQNSDIHTSPYSSGRDFSDRIELKSALDVGGMVTDGRLELKIKYNSKAFCKDTIEDLVHLLKKNLQEVIRHCISRERTELTPSDVLLKELTVEQLDAIVEQTQSVGEVENIYALTPMQKGMLFYNLMDSQSGAYFEQSSFDLKGCLNLAAFTASLELLVQRHSVLRTNFYSGWKDEPLQVVYRNKRSELYIEDLRDMEEEERNDYILEYTRKDKQRGFDLAEDTLMRVAILRTAEKTYRFVWSFHHILMDGWCLSLVTNEVFASYFAILAHKQPELGPVTPYSQYIEWLEQQDRQAASNYWSRYLDGYEEQSRLPQAKIQSKTGYQTKRLDFDLGVGLTAGIQQIAKRYQVTMNTLMQTVWGMLLQKYNGTDDVVFGSVVSGRPAEIPNVEHIIGLFINTIPVRIHSHKDSLFSDVMKQNQEQSIASQAYDTYPLYEIQGLSELKQDLINHILIFENYPMEEQIEQLGEGEASSFRITGVESVEQTNYDFNLVVLPGNTIHMSFVYNALAFERESVEQIQGHLMELLKQVVANPDISVRELDVLSEPEREQILRVWGDTAADYPSEQTIHGLFEAQAAQTPEQAALFFEGAQLTYRELNERANRLARTLRSHGVTTDSLVGIMTERSVDMIVGMLGIMKAGGAYVPLDPTYPEDRIRYMLDDSGTALLLTQSHLVEKVAFDGKILVLDGEQGIYHEEGANLEPVSGPNDLAYVIYTSGTTGQPKGVMIEHHGPCNLKTYFDETLHMSLSDHVLMFASYSFDVACWEVFQTLFCGATLYVPTMETILNYERFEQYTAEHQITVVMLPPTYAVYLEPKRMSSLRILFTAGSASSLELVQQWKDQVPYYNGYGPTENSIVTTIWPVSEDANADERISIGRPVPNHRVYIVDAHGHLAPVGVAGELCVSGEGLARGYLHRPELTDEKFIPNPFTDGEAGYERMYRTGDLARWMPDGNIEHLGRIDHQVKIRGYRIELGEVEANLLKVEAVQEVIVLSHEDEQGQNQLVAYYVAEREVSTSELRSLLGEKLPNYMVPSYFVQLESMPLTPNGKIDRTALPLPELASSPDIAYVAPRNEVEQQLANLWRAVLGVEKVSIDENFFELGGHSLKAIQLVSKAQESGIPLGIHQVLQHQTIRSLSDLLSLDKVVTKQDTSLLTDVTEAEQWISETFGVQAMLQFVPNDERDYLFLHVHPLRADQVDEMTAGISSHVPSDLHPHYIVPMGEEDASLRVRTGHAELEQTDEEQENSHQRQTEEWILKIAEMNASWHEHLLSSEAIYRFPLAPAQHYHLMHPASSGTVVRLDQYVDMGRLNTAIRQLIHRHELLRSVLVHADGVWEWEVRPTPEHISLPCVDLSIYPVQTQQQLLSSLMSNLYFEPYEQKHALQYRMMLVRLNLREHLLLLPCSHIIFDATSGVVLHNQLLEEYDHIQQSQTVKTFHYHDYVDHIRQGPQGLSDPQIVEQFKLPAFEDHNSRIHERMLGCNYAAPTSYHWNLNLHDIPTQEEAVNLWDISLQMAFQFLSSYFEQSEVPLWLTQYGRQYGDRNYFGSVGEYIDHIPVLLLKEERISYENDIQKLLDTATHHHLNFFNLIFNEEMKSAYPQSSNILKKGLEQLPIVFNYLGEMQGGLNEIGALDRKKEQANGGKAIFFESVYTESVLQISLSLPFEEDHEKIHRIFQAASDRLLTALTISQ